jgi:hypothetical protein
VNLISSRSHRIVLSIYVVEVLICMEKVFGGSPGAQIHQSFLC